MPQVNRGLGPLLVALSVIVILLIVVPQTSSAQTAGSLSLDAVTHSTDGTTVASLSGTAEELASLSVFVDGEPVPFEVSAGSATAASRIVFALENSVSMTPAHLSEVQAAMRGLVDSLAAADEVGIVTFGGGVSVALPPTSDRQAFDAALDAIAIGGGSALYSGVTTAAELADGRPALIVLVTYGWDWGSLSRDTPEQSVSAVSGLPVYVQSMVFDGSVDVAYLAPLASDGVVHDVTQVAAIADAAELVGTAEPTRTLTIAAPALAIGEHQVRVTSEIGAEQVAFFEVVNDGLLSVTVDAGADSSAPIDVQVDSPAALVGYDLHVTVGGTTLELAADGTVTIDPWAFAAGTATLEVTASVAGEFAGSTTRSVTIPSLPPTLTVDRASEETLVATLRAQPGTADALAAVLDGATVAESADGRLEVDRPAAGTLTFEARSLGQVVTSEQVSATDLVDPAVTDPVVADPEADNESNGSSIWTSPVMLVIPAALALVTLFLGRRGWPRPSRRVGRDDVEETAGAAADAETTADSEPIRLAPDATELAPERVPASKWRSSLFDRGAKEEPPIPLHPTDWTVVVRAADGQTRRLEVGYEPVSIGASKLCTVTLDGDAVRFVHLVIAREGRDVKAHQFGPVTVDGQERDVEDATILTEAVMEIGDVAVWLERAVAESAAVDAA